MKIQGLNFLGFRPIKRVTPNGNNGESKVEDINVIYRKSNYNYDKEHNLIYSDPVFEEFRMPRVAVLNILDNYTLSKETKSVLQKYCDSNTKEDLVIKIQKGSSRVWKYNLSFLYTFKFAVIVILLIAILVMVVTL